MAFNTINFIVKSFVTAKICFIFQGLVQLIHSYVLIMLPFWNSSKIWQKHSRLKFLIFFHLISECFWAWILQNPVSKHCYPTLCRKRSWQWNYTIECSFSFHRAHIIFKLVLASLCLKANMALEYCLHDLKNETYS